MNFLQKTIILSFVLLIVSCQQNTNSTLQYHKSKEEKKKNSPFSDAVQVDNLLFLSGQIGMDHSIRKIVDGGIKAETAQALKNIEDVLKNHGSDLNHVVKCTVILADINDFNEMNTVYRTFFTDNLPARTTFAADLVLGAKIEIEVVAVKK